MVAHIQVLTIAQAGTSPEDRERQRRLDLGQAIAAASRAAAKEQQARAAIDRARAQVDRARRDLEKAKEAVSEARARQEARLVQAAKSGDTIAPDTTMRKARAAELEAQDQLEAAQAALVVIEGAAIGPEHEAADMRTRLDKYVGGVLWTKAGPLLAKAQTLQTELIEARVGLRYLLHEFKSDEARARVPEDETTKAVRDFLRNIPELPGTMGNVSYGADWDRHAATKPWRQAREALAKDAEAELPER